MREYDSFACTSIGYSHIAGQKVCQDHSLHARRGGASIAVVSDGHGSANFVRSDRGSRFACEVALEAVDAFLRDLDLNCLEDETQRDAVVEQLCKYILLRWNARVDQDVALQPFTEEEVAAVSDKYRTRYLKGEAAEHAYGCTLLVAIVTGDFCLAIRNGDGQCVAMDRDGRFTTPIPWNDSCVGNITTSLCDSEAIRNFRYYYSANLPAAIFIGSDGVDDSYPTLEELYHLYRSICLKALEDGANGAAEYVARLLPELTRRGSMDDVSIAGLMDLARLAEAEEAMRADQELRRQRLEREQREQRKRVLERDIKVAEKQRAKAEVQRQAVRQKIQSIQSSRASLLEQIFAIQRKADACGESAAALTAEEERLIGVISGADSDIRRIRAELRALEEPAAGGGREDRSGIPKWPSEDGVRDTGSIPDRHSPAPPEPGAEEAVPEDGTTVPEDGTTVPEDGTAAPEDGTAAPEDGTAAPGDGTVLPEDGTTVPEDGTAVPGDRNAGPDPE